MKILNSNKSEINEVNLVEVKSGDQVIGEILECEMYSYEGGIVCEYVFYPIKPMQYIELDFDLEDLYAFED